MTSEPGTPRLRVGDDASELDPRLSKELDAVNLAATGIDDQRELTVEVRGSSGELLGGLSGWTWGTCGGIGMLWVVAEHRGARWGSRLLSAAEEEARRRGCTQMVVSSFTFQAPGFYARHGYVEHGRTEGLPVEGSADVHFRKPLAPTEPE